MQKEHRSGEASILLLGIVVLLAAGIGLAIPVLTYGGLGSSSGAKPLANVTPAVSAAPSPIATKLARPMAEAAELPRLTSASAVPVAGLKVATPTHVPMPGLQAADTPTTPPTRAPAALLTQTATPTRRQPPASPSTETPTPTPAYTPTAIIPADTPTALPTTLPPPASPPELINPQPGAPGSGLMRFQWQATGALADGAAYEVVTWARDEDPNQARGVAPPTLSQSLSLNVDVLFESGQFTDGTLFWTVLVVQTEPYLRFTQPADSPQRLLVYSPGG